MLSRAKSISFKNIKDSDYYKITSIILEQDKPFLFEDIEKEVNWSISNKEKSFLISRALNKLSNNGTITKHGSYFSKI